MKKSVATIVLGTALLATSGVSYAGQQKSTEPQWGLRPERHSTSSPLDLARWFARHFIQSVGLPVPIPVTIEPVPAAAPSAAPSTTTAPADNDLICDPQREHCPIG